MNNSFDDPTALSGIYIRSEGNSSACMFDNHHNKAAHEPYLAHKAAYEARLEDLKGIVTGYYQANYRDPIGATPLHHAAQVNTIINSLLNLFPEALGGGENRRIYTRIPNVSLTFSCSIPKGGDTECLAFLLRKGAEVNLQDKR